MVLVQRITSSITVFTADQYLFKNAPVTIGKKHMEQYEVGWTGSINEPLANKVIIVSIIKKRIKFVNTDCFDTNLIYSRVMGMFNYKIQ